MIPSAKTDSQEWLAWVMAIGDLGFACLTGGYHLMQLLNGANPPEWMGQVVGVIMVVALIGNVGGGFVFYIMSPSAIEARMERRLKSIYDSEKMAAKEKLIREHAKQDALQGAMYDVDNFRAEFKGRNSTSARVNGHSFDGGPHSGLADAEKKRLMKQKTEDSEDEANASLQAAQQSRWNSNEAGNE
jgi:hypothetical protein